MLDVKCKYPGRFMPNGGGSVTRGNPTKDRFDVDTEGCFIDLSLRTSVLSMGDAESLADYLRDLTLDTGSMYPSITLWTGANYDFLEVESNRLGIEDIAHALSMFCRFGGHISHFYSVAEHSVRASYITPPEDAFSALMHDAAESVMADLPTPLKRMLRDYERLIEQVEANIAKTHGFAHPLPPSVKRADLIMLATEKRDLKPNSSHWAMLDGVEPLPETLIPWSPAEAEAKFLARYAELTGIDLKITERT